MVTQSSGRRRVRACVRAHIFVFLVRFSSCGTGAHVAEQSFLAPSRLSWPWRAGRGWHGGTRKYCSGELNHSPYLRRHCSQYSMSRLISTTSASSTCQCASRLDSTLTRSDLASAGAGGA